MHMLDELTISLLKDNQLAGVDKKMLTKEQLELIYANKWFLIWVPKEFGGLELGLEEGCSLLEELAYIDGGLSWTVTLCAGANMFVGFLDQALARDIFANSQVCFGGSGKVGGKTEKVSGGYRVSGTWPYATGAPHLTHFTANCPVDDVDTSYKSFFFDRDDVLIHYDWDTFGLEATASHSFSVENLFVPEERAFDILPERATSTSPLFRVPFMPFAEATLYVNYVGMFRRFCDLVFRYYTGKSADQEWMKQYGHDYFDRLDEARKIIQEGRGCIYDLIRELWGNVLVGKDSDNDNSQIYDQLATETRKQVRLMKEQLVALFPTCGIAAAQRDNEMNMVFRNFFTATQHSLLNRKA